MDDDDDEGDYEKDHDDVVNDDDGYDYEKDHDNVINDDDDDGDDDVNVILLTFYI